MCLAPELKLWELLKKHVSVLAEGSYKTQGSRSFRPASCSEERGREAECCPQIGRAPQQTTKKIHVLNEAEF